MKTGTLYVRPNLGPGRSGLYLNSLRITSARTSLSLALMAKQNCVQTRLLRSGKVLATRIPPLKAARAWEVCSLEKQFWRGTSSLDLPIRSSRIVRAAMVCAYITCLRVVPLLVVEASKGGALHRRPQGLTEVQNTEPKGQTGQTHLCGCLSGCLRSKPVKKCTSKS